MTYIVSSGALNSTHSLIPKSSHPTSYYWFWQESSRPTYNDWMVQVIRLRPTGNAL